MEEEKVGTQRVFVDVDDTLVEQFIRKAIERLRPSLEVVTGDAAAGPYALALLEERRERSVLSSLASLRARSGMIPVIVASTRDRFRFMTAGRGPLHLLRKPFGLREFEEVLDFVFPSIPGEPLLPRPVGACPPPPSQGSPAISLFQEELRRLAPSNLTVLLRGKTGSGKGYFARQLHRHSRRSGGPFITLDCSTLSASLIESELFGHVKGAFTGAERDSIGLAESAEGGTLFIDEIGDLPLGFQPKLLRLLQDKECRRVGQAEARVLDIRIVAATNADLEQRLRQGQFREDLYYRLNGTMLWVPSLAERIEDLPRLLAEFLEEFAQIDGRAAPRLTEAAHLALLRHPWPGNVRELRNLAERLLLREGSNPVDVADLVGFLRNAADGTSMPRGKRPALGKDVVLRALSDSSGVISHAAGRLGLSRQGLYNLMKKYSLPSGR
jgi:DNA-binding NtrC family response regulator